MSEQTQPTVLDVLLWLRELEDLETVAKQIQKRATPQKADVQP
jgi:hypothetical protein